MAIANALPKFQKKWVLDSKTPLVAPPRHTVQASKKTRLLAKNSPKTRPFLGGEFWRVFFFLVGILPWEKCTHENMREI